MSQHPTDMLWTSNHGSQTVDPLWPISKHPTGVFRTSCGATAPLELKVSGPGWGDGERRVFEHPFVLVGRQEGSCLRLEDGEVSRRHAYLQQLGGRVFCVDLGSRTGIRWGGK